MPDEIKDWRWVPGDDKDPAEVWHLKEGDRTILTCGQVDAIDQAEILAGRLALKACREIVDLWARYMADDDCVNPHDYPIGEAIDTCRVALAAARGEGAGDG